MGEGVQSSERAARRALVGVLVLYAIGSIVGIHWGLPTSRYDDLLFRSGEPWPGEKIQRLAGEAARAGSDLGADVDVNPLDKSGVDPILLTGSDEQVAEIYRRYRLFTHQPDEMITMMALSGMRPGRFDFDPRLYQYGGLFIYPVGALIKACGMAGLIDVRSDTAFYLDHPDEFGKFYIVARAYAAAWGALGLVVVFAIGRRLAGAWAGVLAALVAAVMPVMVCMSHEGKPHLPGATLMLMAVLFGMRHLDEGEASSEASARRRGGGLVADVCVVWGRVRYGSIVAADFRPDPARRLDDAAAACRRWRRERDVF